MEKKIVQVLGYKNDIKIKTYFPNELAAMFVARGYIAYYLPSYLVEQAL